MSVFSRLFGVRSRASDEQGTPQASAPSSAALTIEEWLDVLENDQAKGPEAARALAQTRDSRVVEPLIRALEPLDRSPSRVQGRQMAAAEALGSLGNPCAISPLLQLALNRSPQVAARAQAALERLGEWWRSEVARTMMPDLLEEVRHPYAMFTDVWPRKALGLIDATLSAGELAKIDDDRAAAKGLQGRAAAQTGFCQWCGKPSASYQLRTGKFACDDTCLKKYLFATAFDDMTVTSASGPSGTLQAHGSFCWACGKMVAPRAEACDACRKPQTVDWQDVDRWASEPL